MILPSNNYSWCTVGLFNEHCCIVDGYYSFTINKDLLNYENAPKNFEKAKISLIPDTVYAFRVAGVNICGTGNFVHNNLCITRTTAELRPATPDNCKVVQHGQAIQLEWTPVKEAIDEYSVYGAVDVVDNDYKLEKLYSGSQLTCQVPLNIFRNLLRVKEDENEYVVFRIFASGKNGTSAPLTVKYIID
jgi:hypothetical protein